MKIQETAELTPPERFLYWVKERHSIYLKKAVGKTKPWTDDEVLQRYFFTNPYRENDKVTVWVRDNIRTPYADHPNLWFMLCIARQINWPETLQGMMDAGLWPLKRWDAKRVAVYWDRIKAEGGSVYTGAYMIRAESDRRKPWFSWTKQQYMSKICLGSVWKARKQHQRYLTNTLEEACGWLQQFTGWGGFMSYEVVSDLRWTRYLSNAPDIMTWANPGPGAVRGLNWYFGRPVKTKLRVKIAVEEMQQLLAVCHKQLPKIFPKFEMRDVEHSLCEYDKYNRMLFGTGRSKRKYEGV